MIKAIMFAATLATAGAGVVYAQQSGTTGGSPGSTMGTGAERGTGTMGTERGTGGTMGRSGTMGAREGAQTGATAQMMTTLPQHATAVSNWYDQNVAVDDAIASLSLYQKASTLKPPRLLSITVVRSAATRR